MAANTYEIKALINKDKSIHLELKIISPDEYYFYAKKNFVLQLLWDAAQLPDKENSALNKAISMEQILDSKWVLTNEAKFIAKVYIKETKNQPTEEQIAAMNNTELDKFRKEHGIPSAIYEITLTEANWGEHIAPGTVWKSAAYDLED